MDKIHNELVNVYKYYIYHYILNIHHFYLSINYFYNLLYIKKRYFYSLLYKSHKHLEHNTFCMELYKIYIFIPFSHKRIHLLIP